MRTVETSRNGVRGVKENDGGGELNMIYCKNFINVTMYPQYNNNKQINE
jgi:hypothetical protein